MADGASAELARHISTVDFSDLPPAAAAVTKAALVDAVGVMFAASGLGEGCDAFAELARDSGEAGHSTVLGWDFATSPAMAAFANGAAAHALDFEDTHDATLVHPHAAVIPAALATAQAIGQVSGRAFLTAIATGADLSCRLALGLADASLGPTLLALGYRLLVDWVPGRVGGPGAPADAPASPIPRR